MSKAIEQVVDAYVRPAAQASVGVVTVHQLEKDGSQLRRS